MGRNRLLAAFFILFGASCASDFASQTTASTGTAAAPKETARIVLIEHFVALAAEDYNTVDRVRCSPAADLPKFFVAYRQAVATEGPIRLTVASVQSEADVGDIRFRIRTDKSTLDLLALLQPDDSGGICLGQITNPDGVTKPSLPVWPE